MIRVFIADDHAIVRKGLRQLFSEERDLDVCGESATAEGLVERAGTEKWDVLILDVNIPGGSGPDLVSAFAQLPSPPAVIIYTMYPEDSHAIAFLRAGALAFINKKRSIDELVEAIRKVHSRKRYLTPDLAHYLFEHDIDFEKTPDKIFSQREREVIQGLAVGSRPIEIAAGLGISASTVNTFIQRIKGKLGVHSAVEIVEFARVNGLLG
jgi:DNA-binding NarL/FixJ family response regulator